MEKSKDDSTEPQPRGRIQVKAVVKRANGEIEDLGIISEGWVSLDTPDAAPE